MKYLIALYDRGRNANDISYTTARFLIASDRILFYASRSEEYGILRSVAGLSNPVWDYAKEQIAGLEGKLSYIVTRLVCDG